MVLIDFAELIVNAAFAIIPCKRPKPPSWDKFKIIAHRGAHNWHYKENTLAAFHHALKLGTWGIEFDIQYTKESIPVVHHNPRCKSTCGFGKKINSLPLEKLRKLAPTIPTLHEVITSFGQKQHLFIELKAAPPKPGLFLQELEPLTPGIDYHIIALNKDFFKGIECISAKYKLLVSTTNTTKIIAQSLTTPFGGVLGSYVFINSAYRDSLKKAKQKAGVGQVNSTFNLYRAINHDIEWIFTNKSNKIISLLRSLKNP